MATTNEPNRTTLLRGKPFNLAGRELQVGETAPDFEVMDGTLQKFKLSDTGSGVRIFSVVPSLDTPVCDSQTKRFEEAAGTQTDVQFFNISMDLPFAQARWCGNFGVERIKMLSDHVSASFGEGYGTLIPDLRIESRAIFVLNGDNRIVHAEYVPNISDHPDYDAALKAAADASAKA